MTQSTVQDRTTDKLPIEVQFKYLSIQAELDLLLQQVRSNPTQPIHKS